MSLNTNLLIQDNSLQEYLVDKTTGFPLANGYIFFYIDTDRTILKPVYKQTGSPGTYSYVELANPLVLSSVGTTVDEFGNDIKIFYYPYDVNDDNVDDPAVQAYYVKVFNSANVEQFVRENWPKVPAKGVVDTNVPTFDNLIINNRFWRNADTLHNPANGATLAPSQHDGFRVPDITYLKNGSGEDETFTFTKFSAGVIEILEDVQPEYYLNFNCTTAGSSTEKYISIPISLHLLTLGSYPTGNITFQGKWTAGDNSVTIFILPDNGTGAALATPALIRQFALTTTWTKYPTGTFTFPPAVPAAVNNFGGDDAFYLLISLPTGVSNISIALPSLYLSEVVPTDEFATYDMIDTVISSPRTGDVRSSMNDFSPYGWVAANNGTIGSAGSTNPNQVRANIDTWPLYNLLWSKVDNTFAPVSGGRGLSAINDFSNNKAMTLPKMLARVMMGLPLTQDVVSFVFATGVFTVADTSLYCFGTPIKLTTTGTLPDAFSATLVYYIIIVSATTFILAGSYLNAINRIPVAFGTTNGTGVLTINPQLASSVGEQYHIQVAGEVGSHTHPTNTQISAADTTLVAGKTHIGYAQDPPADIGHSIDVNVLGNIIPPAVVEGMNVVQPSIYMHVFLKL